MYFETVTDFLAMGNHGLYVWSAYGVAVIIFVYNVVVPILQRRQLRKDIHRFSRRVTQS